MTLKNIIVGEFPKDTASSKERRQMQRVQDNFAALGAAVGGATITVGAEDTNVRQILIQLTDKYGNAIAEVKHFRLAVFASAALTAALATGGSTGIALGT